MSWRGVFSSAFGASRGKFSRAFGASLGKFSRDVGPSRGKFKHAIGRSTARGTTDPAVDLAWRRAQRAGRRWALCGALVGAALGALLFAPATWLAGALHRATDERLLLADARGSVWSGSAVAVLQGGPGSRDASALPGRLHWKLSPAWGGLALTLRQACCLQGELRLALQLELQGMTLPSLRIDLPARPEGIGQWPARALVGLGTPWNTLQLGGTLRLSSPGLVVRRVQGQTRLSGALELQLIDASSRVSAIEPLGSYRVSLRGADPASAGASTGNATGERPGNPTGKSSTEGSSQAPNQASTPPTTLTLDTLHGALRLSGSGQWDGARLRFRGEARAADGQEASLANLLNIIGRRQGALSVISIG